MTLLKKNLQKVKYLTCVHLSSRWQIWDVDFRVYQLPTVKSPLQLILLYPHNTNARFKNKGHMCIRIHTHTYTNTCTHICLLGCYIYKSRLFLTLKFINSFVHSLFLSLHQMFIKCHLQTRPYSRYRMRVQVEYKFGEQFHTLKDKTVVSLLSFSCLMREVIMTNTDYQGTVF